MAGILDEARKRMTNNGRTDIYGNRVAPGGITNYRMPKLYHDVPKAKEPDAAGQCGPGYVWDQARQMCVLVDRSEAVAEEERKYLGHETPAILRVGDKDHRVLTTDYGEDQLRDGGRMGYGGNYIIDKNGEIIPLIDDTGNLTEDGLRIVNLAESGVGIDYTTGHHIQDILSKTFLGQLANTLSGGAFDLPDERDPASGTLEGVFTGADPEGGVIPTGLVKSDIDVNNDGVIDELDHIFVSPQEARSGLHTDRIEGNPEVGYTYQGQHYATFEEAKAARDGTRGGITGAASQNKAVAAVAAALGVAQAVVQKIAEVTGISDPQQLAQAVQESTGGDAGGIGDAGIGDAGIGDAAGGHDPFGTGTTYDSAVVQAEAAKTQDAYEEAAGISHSPAPSQPSGGYDSAGRKTGVHNEPGRGEVNYGGGDTGYSRSDSGREGSGTGGAAKSGEYVSSDHDWSRPNRGGYISEDGLRLNRGGFPGQPMGTDNVPAWLTAGEYVTNKPATEMFGKDIAQYNNIGRQVQDPNVTVKGGTWEAMHELDRLINMAAEGYWKGGKV